MSYYPGWIQLNAYTIKSIYGGGLNMPARLALATPDTVAGLSSLSDAVAAAGGELILSDGYRSYDVQMAAYKEYIASLQTDHPKPKRSKPGASMHSAGRAIDFSLNDALKSMTLAQMWALMGPLGWFPIINTPDTHINESWHIEFRGPFQQLYTKYGYTRMVRAAVASIRGIVFDDGDQNDAAHVQYQLIRLGCADGLVIDGEIGPTTQPVLEQTCQQYVAGWEQLSHRQIADALASIEPDAFRF